MGCNCKATEIIIAVVILVVTLWDSLLGMKASWWVVVIAAVALLLHALMCKNCGRHMMVSGMQDKSMQKSKKRR